MRYGFLWPGTLPALAATVFSLSAQAATWTAGSGDYSLATNWNPVSVPCFEILPVASTAIIDIPGIEVNQDVPACTVEGLTLGVAVTLRLNDATDYSATNSADIAGRVSGIGGNLSATGAAFTGTAARLDATLGSVIDLDALSLNATSVPLAGLDLLAATGSGSQLALASLGSIDASFNSTASTVQFHSVTAADGGRIDLSGLTSVDVPVDLEDRLSFEVSDSGAILLDQLGTSVGSGQVRFLADNGASLNLPALTALDGGRFVASLGGQITASASAWTLDSSFASNNNYVLVTATNTGSLLDLSGMTALDASFNSNSSSVQYHSVTASDGGSVDLSGLTSVVPPADIEDRLSFEVSDSGTINLDQLSTSIGSGQVRFLADNGASLSLPALTALDGGRFVATGGGQITAAASSWTLDSSWGFNNNYVLISATNPASLLDLSGMTELDASFNTVTSSVQFHSVTAGDGGSIDLSGLTSVIPPADVEDRLSFEVSDSGAINLDQLSTSVGTGQVRFLADNGGSLSLPALTALDGGRFVATGGGQIIASASAWTLDSSSAFNNNYLLISATNPGSTLDLSGMTELDASFNTATSSVQFHSVTASDGGSVDLSGLTNVIPPADVEDRVSFEVSDTGTINLDQLSTSGGPGQVRFLADTGASLILPAITDLNGGRFVATSGGQIFASASAWTLDSSSAFNNNYLLISATNPDSLLDLSGMTVLDASFNTVTTSVQTHTVSASDNATIDMSGVDTLVAPVDVEDLLRLEVGDGATLALGPLSSITGTGRVNLDIDPAGTASFPRGLDAAERISVFALGDSNVNVTGSMSFRHTDETAFDLEVARVAVADVTPLNIEVGGTDEGTTPTTSPNFGFAQLIVGNPAQTNTAVLVDQVDNGNGFEVCETAGEALYLYGFDVGPSPDADGLRILNGSTLDLGGGINLYAAIGGVLMHINPMLTPGIPFPYDEGFIQLGAAPDSDGDGIVDSADNCTLRANADQRDSNGDGFGNICDADLNNDNIVNPVDLGLFKLVFFSADADADFNGDGIVNVVDLGILKLLFFEPPGPSCIAPTRTLEPTEIEREAGDVERAFREVLTDRRLR